MKSLKAIEKTGLANIWFTELPFIFVRMLGIEKLEGRIAEIKIS